MPRVSRKPQAIETSALRRSLDAIILLVVGLALLALAAVSADAGQRRKGGHHAAPQSHSRIYGSHAMPVIQASGHRNHSRHPKAYDSGAMASSGVLLASGKRSQALHHQYRNAHDRRYRASHHGWRQHDRRHEQGWRRGGTALIIQVNTGAQEQAYVDSPRIDGDCRLEAYCVVRLGPFANSPKIITLNASGAALSLGVPQAGQQEPVVISDHEAELKRRYGSK